MLVLLYTFIFMLSTLPKPFVASPWGSTPRTCAYCAHVQG